jgi:hypothetical protein
MFEKYRINKLKIKAEVQQALVDKLEIAEKEYGISYYTNKFHREFCKLVEINSKLKYLQDKYNTNRSI